jgi:dTMP kinase
MWVDFEGIDGCGKTTVSLGVARRLRERGLAVTHVRELGAFRSPLVNRMRELSRSADSMRLSGPAELLLGAARESQLIAEEIRPALARGDVVVTDRALHAHAAVACAVRRLEAGAVDPVLRFAAGGLWPDVVVLVDTDPDVARLRRRLRKIRERRSGPGGRKGLLGQSMPGRCREAFRERSVEDPARWRVLDNTSLTRSEAEQQAYALVAPFLGLDPGPPGPPAPATRVEVDGGPRAWTERYFALAETFRARDPELALLLVAGLDAPEADALRARAAPAAPDVALWSVTGLDGPAAWAIRRDAVEAEPWHAARSLKGLDSEEAWAWRRRLLGSVPDAVAASLARLGGDRAWEARDRLREASPEEILRGLAGMDDPRSWALREASPFSGALVESLQGIDGARAWALRERGLGEHPVSVLRSVKGLADARSWDLRRAFLESAPSEVLESLRGMSGPEADELRDALEGEHPEETAESLAGLDDARAWARRERLTASGPGGVISSLFSFRDRPLALRCVRDSIRSSEGRPRVVRKAIQFHRQPARDLKETPR